VLRAVVVGDLGTIAPSGVCISPRSTPVLLVSIESVVTLPDVVPVVSTSPPSLGLSVT